MAALKRSKKPADALHPFGYGMERYFWSLIAAVGIFVVQPGTSSSRASRPCSSPTR